MTVGSKLWQSKKFASREEPIVRFENNRWTGACQNDVVRDCDGNYLLRYVSDWKYGTEDLSRATRFKRRWLCVRRTKKLARNLEKLSAKAAKFASQSSWTPV